jgi:WD40 repeat protein
MSIAPLSGSDGTAQQFYSAHGTTISLWDTRAAPSTPAATVALSKEGDITSLSVCKSKDFLVACGTESGDSWVYDFRTPAPICRAACIDSQITQEISSVAFSHTGSYVFAGYRKWVKNYMDCVMAVFDVSGCCGSTSTSTSSGSSDEPQLAPHCVIGSNPGITSSAPFTYSYQPSHDTFVSAMGINSDGCALAAASHGGTIAIFRQQH